MAAYNGCGTPREISRVGCLTGDFLVSKYAVKIEQVVPLYLMGYTTKYKFSVPWIVPS